MGVMREIHAPRKEAPGSSLAFFHIHTRTEQTGASCEPDVKSADALISFCEKGSSLLISYPDYSIVLCQFI